MRMQRNANPLSLVASRVREKQARNNARNQPAERFPSMGNTCTWVNLKNAIQAFLELQLQNKPTQIFWNGRRKKDSRLIQAEQQGPGEGQEQPEREELSGR